MRKIAAIVMVKNEMDIIESFVRHTLGFADLLIVADHKSTDRTREILEALKEEGLPVLIEDVAVARHAQAETMTKLLWKAADDYEADLIVPLDADEFLVPTGETSVRELLETMDVEDVQSFRWRRYAPASDEGIPPGVFPFAIPLVRGCELEPNRKLLVSGDVIRREHARLSEGNHLLVRAEDNSLERCRGAFCDGLELAHLPWRSSEQIQSKYAVGWPNIAAKYGRNTITGGGYRYLFHLIGEHGIPERQNPAVSWESYSVSDRMLLPELRYSADTLPDVLQNVMAASEALAQELAETRALERHSVVTTIVPYLRGGMDVFHRRIFPYDAGLSARRRLSVA